MTSPCINLRDDGLNYPTAMLLSWGPLSAGASGAPCATVNVIEAPVARSRVRAFAPADCKFDPRLQRSGGISEGEMT